MGGQGVAAGLAFAGAGMGVLYVLLRTMGATNLAILSGASLLSTWGGLLLWRALSAEGLLQWCSKDVKKYIRNTSWAEFWMDPSTTRYLAQFVPFFCDLSVKETEMALDALPRKTREGFTRKGLLNASPRE